MIKWYKSVFSNSKGSLSFNRHLALFLALFLIWFGFTDKVDAMIVIAGLIASALGFTAWKK